MSFCVLRSKIAESMTQAFMLMVIYLGCCDWAQHDGVQACGMRLSVQ